MPRSDWEPLAACVRKPALPGSLIALALLCVSTVANAADPTFVGTWTTTYGQMVLSENRGTLSGTYGGRNGITGTVSGTKFTFTYFEPGVTGEGQFELSPDGQSFAGKWRPTGQANWSNWTGKRVVEVNPQKAKPPVEDTWEEPKPVVYRYGNLPQGLPKYFTEGDADKDGQIGLYEWVQYWDSSEAKLAEFKALDLNGDGLLTVQEYQRATKDAPATSGPSKGGQPSWGQPPSITANPPRPSGPVVGGPKGDDKSRDPKRVTELNK